MKTITNLYGARLTVSLLGLTLLAAGTAACSSSDDGGLPGAEKPKTGLVLHLKFDEADTNGNATDSSGQGNHGSYGATKPTVSAMTPTVQFPNTGSLGFNGTATVVVPASAQLSWSATESYTMSLWANPTLLSSMWAAPLSNNAGSGDYCGIYTDMGNFWSYENNNTGGPLALPGAAAVVGWQHVAIVQDGMEMVQRIYVNGTAAAATRPSMGCQGNGPFQVGFADGDGFVGQIDDVRIYGNALTAAQVGQLAAGAAEVTGLPE
jgi:hypothetical protein